MNQTIPITDVCQFMKKHLVDVFETMLSMKAAPATETELPHFRGRVTGSVGFAGEMVTGAVYVHLPAAFATRATAAMLGLAPEEVTGETEVNDVVGEIANMLTGGLKSWLCDAGADCAVSTPAIIRGTAFDIESPPEVQRKHLIFNCENVQIVIEIHIKFN